MVAITQACLLAADPKNGEPALILCTTFIGKGIDEIAGTCAAHGEAGVKCADSARESPGLPADQWCASKGARDFFATRKKEPVSKYDEWTKTYEAWKGTNPYTAKPLQDAIDGVAPDVSALIPNYTEVGKGSAAAGNVGAEVLQPIAKVMPFCVYGSADWHGSNKNYMKEVGDFSQSSYAGRNFHYGIREHALGAFLIGIGFYGLLRPSGSTFSGACSASSR